MSQNPDYWRYNINGQTLNVQLSEEKSLFQGGPVPWASTEIKMQPIPLVEVLHTARHSKWHKDNWYPLQRQKIPYTFWYPIHWQESDQAENIWTWDAQFSLSSPCGRLIICLPTVPFTEIRRRCSIASFMESV